MGEEESELIEQAGGGREPQNLPVVQTMTPDNISQSLKVAERALELEHEGVVVARDVQLAAIKADGTGKWIGLLAAGLICTTIVVTILILRNQPDLLKTLIPGLVGVLAGAIGGYGYGFTKGQKAEKSD